MLNAIDEEVYKKIYHRKWDNDENRVYYRQIKTVCKIDNSKIPLAWAREVYEFIRAVKEKFPKITIFNIKERQLELKFYYMLPNHQKTAENIEWIETQLAKTKIILILKNAYQKTIQYFIRPNATQEKNEDTYLRKVYSTLTPNEILIYQQREPVYVDYFFLDSNLPSPKLKDAYAYLDAVLPQWREISKNIKAANARIIRNLRLQIMLKLAEKFSFSPNNSIDSSQEILSLDKYSIERTRALWGNDILFEIMLKLYEKGDRESINKLQLGEWTDSVKNLEADLLLEKEKKIIVENIVAFYQSKSNNVSPANTIPQFTSKNPI